MRLVVGLGLAGCAGSGPALDVEPEPYTTPTVSTPAPTTPTTTPTTPTAPVHSDADCLADHEELALGTDPLDPDTDGDGLDDCAEVACVSDPTDLDEVCYTCGWPHGDPGGLVSTGSDVGDVVADMTLWDQCEEPLSLYDLHGSYVLVFSTTMWCGTCIEEAQALGADAASLSAELDVPLVPVIALFQDATGNAPLTDQGAAYAEALGLSGFPVTADQLAATTTALPYEPDFLPGWCALAPDLTILGCHAGPQGHDQVRAWILDHRGR